MTKQIFFVLAYDFLAYVFWQVLLQNKSNIPTDFHVSKQKNEKMIEHLKFRIIAGHHTF